LDPQRGSIHVTPADTRGLLSFGTLLNDNVVLGYLNLLAVKFNGLGIPVRIVAPQFYPAFLQEGWTKVQRWVKETGFMQTNWQTAEIIVVPIFTGPMYGGHWSGFTVDRTIPIGPTGIRVYKDSLSSLSSQRASNDLKAYLSTTPLVDDTSIWVTADTPVQEAGSNDCAVWMCCGFTAYLKASLQKTLVAKGATDVSGKVGTTMQLLRGLSSQEWGHSGRQHIHDSFQNRAINLDDPAVAALAVSIHNVAST
jgi:Ulp1 family protease